MEHLPIQYLGSLYAAGTLIVMHVVLHVFGFGHRAGLPRDPIGRMGANLAYDTVMVTYSAIVALLVFGLVGLLGTLRGWLPATCNQAAFAAGLTTFAVGVGIERLLKYVARQSDAGRIKALVGLTGIVSAAVPENRQGRGSVQLIVRMRPTDFPAVTDGAAITVGSTVKVDAVAGPGLLAVVPEIDYGQVWRNFTADSLTPASDGDSTPPPSRGDELST